MGGPRWWRVDPAGSLLSRPAVATIVAWLVLGCEGRVGLGVPVPAPAGVDAPAATVGSEADARPTVVAPSAASRAVALPASRPALDLDAAITVAALERDVETLAADTLGGRATPSPGLDAAADIVASRFRELGLASPPGIDDYRQRFECGGAFRPGEAANVLAWRPGRDADAPAVIVSAHYDHIGSRPGKPDPVFNGANDNASGVAAMLAIAKVVADLDPPPARSVLFAAFCGEELGLKGSTYFAEHAPVALDAAVAGINLEMLGRADPKVPGQIWVTGYDYSTLPALAAEANDGRGVSFVSSAEIGPAEADAFDRSDNYPLARQGVVAHTFSAGSLDDYYHAANDEADTMDFVAMAPLVRGLARVVVALADGARAPTWTAAGRGAGFSARE